MNKKDFLRNIPPVNQLLTDKKIQEVPLPKEYITSIIRKYLAQLREKILKNEKFNLEYEWIVNEIVEILEQKNSPDLCRVLNATGVILHSGLGRAILPKVALQKIQEQLEGYCLLEVSRHTGTRYNRDSHIKEILCYLTGAEDATVVNNNAAAVLLVLSALAKDQEVVVGRDQLVEIGGSFRIPEVMSASGAKLVTVGCTNKVHLADYEDAITEETSVLLQVHTSNYKIMGFAQSVHLKELASLAQRKKLHLVEDAGSGAIFDFVHWGLSGEPVIAQSIKKGADIVTFSGDKLLGGVQAGIIVGKASLLKKIRKHPLARALRVDKITLVALEATLKLYLNKEKVLKETPTLTMLTTSAREIKKRAQKIVGKIRMTIPKCKAEIIPSYSQIGSGALPTQQIPSYVVAVIADLFSPDNLAKSLRLHSPPVFARIQNDLLLFDPRTLQNKEDEELVTILQRIIADGGK